MRTFTSFSSALQHELGKRLPLTIRMIYSKTFQTSRWLLVLLLFKFSTKGSLRPRIARFRLGHQSSLPSSILVVWRWWIISLIFTTESVAIRLTRSRVLLSSQRDLASIFSQLPPQSGSAKT